jgi:hypothetical protein
MEKGADGLAYKISPKLQNFFAPRLNFCSRFGYLVLQW